MKLRCRCVVPARSASSSWLQRRELRHRRSSEANRLSATVAIPHKVLRRRHVPPTIDHMPTTEHVIKQFNDAFQTRSPELLPDLIAEDCVMEAISPAPDGTRTEGHDACLKFWQDLIDDPTVSFDVEDVVVRDDRAIIRWRLNTPEESVRGVNLMHVEDGKIVEALGYAKRP